MGNAIVVLLVRAVRSQLTVAKRKEVRETNEDSEHFGTFIAAGGPS